MDIFNSYSPNPDQEDQRQIRVNAGNDVVSHHPVAAGEPFLAEARRKYLDDIEKPEQEEAAKYMPGRRRDQNHGELKAGHFVDDDLRGIFLPEKLFRLLGQVNGQKGKGHDGQQVKRPGETRENKVKEYPDNRPGRTGGKGRETAAEAGRSDSDEPFYQKTPRLNFEGFKYLLL